MFRQALEQLMDEAQLLSLRQQAFRLLKSPNKKSLVELYEVLDDMHPRVEYRASASYNGAYWTHQYQKLNRAYEILIALRVLRDQAYDEQLYGVKKGQPKVYEQISIILDAAFPKNLPKHRQAFVFPKHTTEKKHRRIFKDREALLLAAGIHSYDMWAMNFDRRLSRRIPRAMFIAVRRPFRILGL